MIRFLCPLPFERGEGKVRILDKGGEIYLETKE